MVGTVNHRFQAIGYKLIMKAIIFDLGNVLIDFDHSIAAARISKHTNKTPQEIYNFFFDSPLTALFEEGKISEKDFYLEVKKSLDLKISYEEFLPIWNEIFFLSEKNKAVQFLAKALKKKFKIAVLSNINWLHYEYINKNYPVFGIFDYVFLSCELKSKKPDLGIYKVAMETLGVLPQETFYTDDRADLIEESLKLGMKSFIFKDSEKLKKDLASCGIHLE